MSAPDRPAPERSAPPPAGGRWLAVGVVGVVCGLLDGGVFYALTGSVPLAVAIGVPTASILVVLGVLGSRQKATAASARAAHEARRARQRRAIGLPEESAPSGGG